MSEDKKLATYSVLENLYRAALEAEKELRQRGLTETKAYADVAQAIHEAEGAIREREEFADLISKARDDYTMDSSCNVEIDDDPVLSVADEGIWVSAWVWVKRPDDDGEDEEEGGG